MGDEERTPADIKIVREIAEATADIGRPTSKLGIKSFHPAEIGNSFSDLVARVEVAVAGGRHFLNDQRRKQLAQSFSAGLRIFAFYERIDIPFVFVLKGMENVYDASVLVDVFSGRALKGVGVDTSPPTVPPPDQPDLWQEFRPLVGRLADRKQAVETVARDDAARNFTTLFVDTLRGLARSVQPQVAAAQSSTTMLFTVHSGPGNKGYGLAVFPQYRYNPVSFGGSKLSTPVDDHLPTGHWCFEGIKAGMAQPIRDRWPHFAGPNNTSTKTTAF